MIYIFIFFSIGTIILSLYLSKVITLPIIDLNNASQEVMKGNYDTKVKVKTKDEVGELAFIFNKMINNIKKSTDELNKTNEQLTQLNQELDGKITEINKLLNQKNDLITQLGHDLRTPLGPLVTLLPIVYKKEQNGELKEMLSVITRNANFLNNIVKKTMRYVEVNAPEFEIELTEINLKNEIDEIIEKNNAIFQENNIIVNSNIRDDIIIEADKLIFDELIDNLLSNYVKYSPEGGNVNIDVKKEQDFTTLSIKDQGIGMTQEQIDHVFDEFFKADGSRHDFDSSGLGMSTSKIIFERHEGKIWVESEGTGKGTSVHFTLRNKHHEGKKNNMK